jgi:hypothetical protein
MKKLTFILSITLTLCANAQVPSYVPTDGLVGWWPFNGNANDESGNGNNGTVNGANLTADRFGNVDASFSFNAFNWTWGSGGDFIYVPYNSNLNSSQITVSVWFSKSSNYISNQSLPSIIKRFEGGYSNPNGQTWGILCNTNGDLLNTFVLPPNTTNNYTVTLSQVGPLVESEQWHNAILMFDGISMKTYFNGELVSTIPANNMLINTNGSSGISVGMSIQANGNWDPFNGKIDDIGIWNRALTPAEVLALYNGCSDLITDQPSPQTVTLSELNAAQFTVSSPATNLSYQWQTNLGLGFQNLSDAGQYSGTASSTLSVNNVTIANNNQQFRCIVEDGSCPDTTDIAVLTVIDDLSIEDLKPNSSKKLLKITDLNGKETPFKKNTVLLFIYEDGTVERVYEAE